MYKIECTILEETMYFVCSYYVRCCEYMKIPHTDDDDEQCTDIFLE